MASRREAPNGDGRTFAAPDGGRLDVFGRNNPDGATLADTVKDDVADLVGPSGKITYRAQEGNWAVYSGENGDKLFYSKSFRQGDHFSVFELTYPRTAAARYRSVVGQLSRCFRTIG